MGLSWQPDIEAQRKGGLETKCACPMWYSLNPTGASMKLGGDLL